MDRRRAMRWIGGTAAGWPLASRVSAQAWPARPIRVLVGYPAGGAVDVMTRAVTDRMGAELGQQVVVENRPGANSNIAIEAVLAAPRDGYTLLASGNFLLVNPVLESGLKWKFEDFAPVARYSQSASYLIVPANSPYSTLAEWIDAARRPGGIQFGDGGVGSTQTLSMRMLERAAGLRLESVYYKGGPQMIQDLIGGQLPSAMMPAGVALPAIRSGRAKPLAITAVPTLAEAGYPSATAVSWGGLHAAVGTPPDVIARLARAVETACATQDARTRLDTAGGEDAYLGPDRFSGFIQSEARRWLGLLADMKKPGG